MSKNKNKKIKYWEKFKSLNCEEFDKTLSKIHNRKIKINLHEHSSTDYRYPKIINGNRYYVDVSKYIIDTKYSLVKIDKIYRGVVFYTEIDTKTKGHFEIGSLCHQFAEPEEYITDLNPEHYEILSISGKMKVIYDFKGYDNSILTIK